MLQTSNRIVHCFADTNIDIIVLERVGFAHACTKHSFLHNIIHVHAHV